MTQIQTYYLNNQYGLITLKGRRKFTPQEDENLRDLIRKMGSHNWDRISQFMPGRSAKQCRDRFCNYLNEEHTNEPWNEHEDQLLIRLMSIVGSKWATIAKYIPKRSGNDVKNRWYKHLSKKYSFKLQNILEFPANNEKENESLIVENTSGKNENNNYSQIYDKYSISSLLWNNI